jgi:D-3-phosphoglycerate dehydrogenase / 2-oxoglutarate reductase
MHRVLISAPYMLPVIDQFAPEFAGRGIEIVRAPVIERLEEHDLLSMIAEFDGTICGDDRYTARVIDAAKRLKVIVKWGTGIDSIDSAAATKRGIRVCRTPNAFSEPVADSVLGYILCFARRLPWMDRMMKQGTWEKIPGHALNEATIGVVGVGDVGSAVLRRARGFGMRLLGADIREIEAGKIEALGVTMMPLDRLLAEADYVSLNCDLNPTSQHLMNTRTFSLMKRSAVVINAARGPVIDEGALVDALRSGGIAGAAMDVFEDEPLPADSPLRRMENVMLAPHNSNSSPRAWSAVHRNSIDQLVAGLGLSA